MSGFAFLPTTLVTGVSAVLTPLLIKRFGYKGVLVVAPLLLAAGLYSFSYLKMDWGYLDLLPGLLLAPMGLGFSFVSISIAATEGVPGRESGLVSGLITTAQQIGGSLGLAILSTIAASKTAEVLTTLPHTQNAVAQATIEGYASAFSIGLCFALVASLLALLFIRRQQAAEKQQAVENM
jgi:MFS family permease